MPERPNAKSHRLDKRGEFEGQEVWFIGGMSKFTKPHRDVVVPVEWRLCQARGVRDQRDRKFLAAFKCSSCEAQFDEDEVVLVKGKEDYQCPPPPHAIMLTHQADLDERIDKMLVLVGMTWHEAADSIGDWRRTLHTRSKEEALAEVVRNLGVALTQQAAVASTVKAVKALAEMKVGDEFCGFGVDAYPETEGRDDEEAPFFSEAFLYRLLGKGAARTALAYFKDVTKAAGLGR